MSAVSPMPPAWPDSTAFWRDKRVIVTGGSGCPGSCIGATNLPETIARLTGLDGRIVWDTTKPNGQPRRKLDVSRAQERFGFASTTHFEAGLERTIAWYIEQRTTETGNVRGTLP